MTDIEYMNLALTLAKSVKGQTSPNPPVGSVVVKDGRIVGMGAHLKAGEAHAEVHAIKLAGALSENSTVYVTLEPCSHFGKTPPCANLLIDSKVARVVVATTDPNPLVAGAGIAMLREAGIEVVVGVLQSEANELYEMFFHYISTKTPFVTLKTAVTLDGKTASRTGNSKWITGALAREDVHRYRHSHDAILVGVNTVIQDDPSLTTRLPNGGIHPIRIVLDHRLRTPIHSKVVNDNLAETWIVISASVTEDTQSPYLAKGIKLIQLKESTIQIKNVLNKLGELGITSLLIEGGSEVNGSFMKARAFNQVITYMAPKLIGGSLSPGFIGGEGIATMADATQLTFKSMEQLGEDLKIIAVPIVERGDHLFTGIIEEIGTVDRMVQRGEAIELSIQATIVLEDIKLGDSISVNGVCLTVTSFTNNRFSLDVMPETVRATSLQALRRGSKVNLERAMAAKGRFGGHFVSGHVDGTGTILKKTRVANAVYYEVEIPESLRKFILLKGSICVDGTSLTVFGTTDKSFTISLIPHTLTETILGLKDSGDIVNLECDMLAKYIEQFVMLREKETKSSGLSESFLRENGYM